MNSCQCGLARSCGVPDEVPAIRNTRMMNPHGVGYTGETLKDHTATCDCCQMEFTFRAPANRGGDRVRCDHCASHQPQGTMSEQLSALREHQDRYPPIVATARGIAREAKADQKASGGQPP
jgi:hypothetical protein